MNAVKDIQSLIQLIHSRYEVIIFPIGDEGRQLLDFLRYANFLHRICCIAATEVEGDNTAQHFIHEVPIIPFEHLMHFRETALLIVVAPNQHYQHLIEELVNFGFKNIVCIDNELKTQINGSLQNMASSGQIMMWFMNHFDRKINDLEHRIEEQIEVSRVNTKAFAEYRNAFRGKEVVIVGTGPTLKYYKPIPNAIHIGLNFAWRNENIEFEYLFAHDNAYFKLPEKELKKSVRKISGKHFIGRRTELAGDCWRNSPEDTEFIGNAVHYYVNQCVNDQTIYKNICTHPLMNIASVALPAFHFSLFTYPKRIYLVGCDVSNSGHFYDKTTPKAAHLATYQLKPAYARMKMFARLYYPETEIISINPVGLRGLFKDIYTDEYQASLNDKKG